MLVAIGTMSSITHGSVAALEVALFAQL